MTATNELTWEEPELSHPNGPRWFDIALQLKARPGEWARIAECTHIMSAGGIVGSLRHPHTKLPSGDFEAARSGLKVYMRFLRERDDGTSLVSRPGTAKEHT